MHRYRSRSRPWVHPGIPGLPLGGYMKNRGPSPLPIFILVFALMLCIAGTAEMFTINAILGALTALAFLSTILLVCLFYPMPQEEADAE